MSVLRKTKTWVGAIGAAAAFVGLLYGCGSGRESFEEPPEPAPVDPFDPFEPDADCGLECRVQQCPSGTTTSISGVVLDPAGKLPIYNAIVYVPSKEVEPFPEGVSCDKCGVVASGDPIVSTLTNTQGEFKLTGVPSGKDVPLVIQVGKWRRQLVVPNVEQCVDNPIDDREKTRLPRKKSEGDIPLIAVTSGCDPMECMLQKIGIDNSEFTTPFQNGRVHLYKTGDKQGLNGSPFAETLWENVEELKRYDIVLMSCECEFNAKNKSEAARKALKEYLEAGGRVFGNHFQSYWFREGPDDFKATADWLPTAQTSDKNARTLEIDMSFPKGQALAEWLVHVGSSEELGKVPMSPSKSVGEVNPAVAQRWAYQTEPDAGVFTKYLSVNTPIGKPADEQCGRFVFSDLHFGGSDTQSSSKYFPDVCKDPDAPVVFNPEAQKVLEFLFFDLSACVQDDKKLPQPPK